MRKGKVLIVDDEPVVRDVLSNILENVSGYATDCAVDGIDGITKVKNNEYDLILTDLNMPKFNGIDFLRELKTFKPFIPVVMITGFSTIDNAINAMKEGARDFIKKPFKVDQITSIVDVIFGERNLIKKLSQNGDQQLSIESLNSELFKRLQEINMLQSIGTELDCLYNNNEIYERIVEMASKLLKVKEVSFGIVRNGFLDIKSSLSAEKKVISLSNSVFEKAIENNSYYIASHGEINPYNGASLTFQFFTIPFMINDEIFGFLNLSNKADGSSFTEDEISLARTFARKAALRIENNALYEVLYSNLINTLKTLIMNIEARDSYTKHHSERVTLYALQIAEMINIASEERNVISFGGYLHDIGKIGVRDTVLLKPGRLTNEEFEEIKLHPVIGDDIIRPISFFPKERELIRHHHEKFDGTGYPDKLSGEKIPINARILSVADTYDAMTSSRPYREAKSHDFAIKVIKRCSNTQFDGEIVSAFLQTIAGRGVSHEAEGK